MERAVPGGLRMDDVCAPWCQRTSAQATHSGSESPMTCGCPPRVRAAPDRARRSGNCKRWVPQVMKVEAGNPVRGACPAFSHSSERGVSAHQRRIFGMRLRWTLLQAPGSAGQCRRDDKAQPPLWKRCPPLRRSRESITVHPVCLMGRLSFATRAGRLRCTTPASIARPLL
jgi:hypothetical protein